MTDDYSRDLLAGTERYYPDADNLRAEVKALPNWGTRDFDHKAWAVRPRWWQYCPPGIHADDDVYCRLYAGETGKQWQARCDLLGTVPGSLRSRRVALLEKLQRPRERVDEDQADGKAQDDSDDEPPDWETPDGISLHATRSDRDATPDVIAEDFQARDPNWDKNTDQYDRITAVRPDQRNPVDVRQWFRFTGACGFSTPLTYSPVTSDLGNGCPTFCGYCVRPPGHEGSHQFSSGDQTGHRGSFVEPGWEAAAMDVVLKRKEQKRKEQKRAAPPDMTWYTPHWRVNACPNCGRAPGPGHVTKGECPASGKRKVG